MTAPARLVGTRWRRKPGRHKAGRPATTWTVHRVSTDGLLVLISNAGSKTYMSETWLTDRYDPQPHDRKAD